MLSPTAQTSSWTRGQQCYYCLSRVMNAVLHLRSPVTAGATIVEKLGVCATRQGRDESWRLFLKRFWKSQLLQLLHSYPRRQDPRSKTRTRVSNPGAPSSLLRRS